MTYWKNLKTNMIYKYENGTKPHNWETEWVRVSAWEYDHAFELAWAKYCLN